MNLPTPTGRFISAVFNNAIAIQHAPESLCRPSNIAPISALNVFAPASCSAPRPRKTTSFPPSTVPGEQAWGSIPLRCMMMGMSVLLIFSVLTGEGRWWELSSSSVAMTMVVLESGMKGWLYIVTLIGASSAMVYMNFARFFFVVFRIVVMEEFQFSRYSRHFLGEWSVVWLECGWVGWCLFRGFGWKLRYHLWWWYLQGF